MCFLECPNSRSCKIQALVELLVPIDSFPDCNMDIRAGTRRAIGMVITVEIKYHQSKSNKPTSDPQPSLLSSCIFFPSSTPFCPGIYFPSYFCTSLHPLSLSLGFPVLRGSSLNRNTCPRLVHSARPHIAFANTNKRVRQMTLITVHLEWKALPNTFRLHRYLATNR